MLYENHYRMTIFSNLNGNQDAIKKKIRYLGFSNYESQILEFCTWLSEFDNQDEIKKIMSRVYAFYFFSNSEIFLSYISRTKYRNKAVNEQECYLELSSIIEAFNIYNRLLYNYQALTSYSYANINQYINKDFDYLFSLYSYYLYQDNSPIVEDFLNKYYQEIKKLYQNAFLIETYNKISSNCSIDLKRLYNKMLNNFESLAYQKSDNDLKKNIYDTKIKVLKIKHHSSLCKRK